MPELIMLDDPEAVEAEGTEGDFNPYNSFGQPRTRSNPAGVTFVPTTLDASLCSNGSSNEWVLFYCH